jgi:malonyl-CoA O-methyltransferase
VLDVGCGTGAMLLALGAGGAGTAFAAGVDLAHGMHRVAARALPAARLAGGDAEALPFRDAAFDLVASASAFQWLPDLAPALAEARRVLRPGGTLALALFCGETLRELRAAWRDALPDGAPPSTHRFHAPAAVREALLRAGLAPLRFEAERRVVRHASVLELLESLRGIGAGNAVAGRGGGLGLRRAVREATRLYEERHGGEGGVPATWDVAYAVARRA